MDTSRNAHYSSYAYQRPQETVQPPTKEIYQYVAPWATYALDWCKSPIEQKSFRLAIGSFIEDSNNKVIPLDIFERVSCLFFFNSFKLLHVQIYWTPVYPLTKEQISLQWQKQIHITLLQKFYGNLGRYTYYLFCKHSNSKCISKSDLRNADLLATTGDVLRIWELVDDPRYGQSNLINSSTRANHRHIQQLVKKAELVNVSNYLKEEELHELNHFHIR